jgi:hypothetical protein
MGLSSPETAAWPSTCLRYRALGMAPVPPAHVTWGEEKGDGSNFPMEIDAPDQHGVLVELYRLRGHLTVI